MNLSKKDQQKISLLENLTYEGYKPCGLLGFGISGFVFKVVKAGDFKAIKVPRIDQFQDVIKTGGEDLAKLRGHKNIVQLVDDDPYYIHDDGFPYIMMEFLEGNDVSNLISKSYSNNAGISRGMDVDVALPILIQTIEGLKYAHSKGIIHGDLRTQNIFVKQNDIVKLMDFGMYKAALDINHPEVKKLLDEYDYDDFNFQGDKVHSKMKPSIFLTKQACEQKFTEKLDTYQFGKTAYQILTGNVITGLFDEVSEILGSEYDCLDEMFDSIVRDNEDKIKWDLDDVLNSCKSAQGAGYIPEFRNKCDGITSSFNYSLSCIDKTINSKSSSDLSQNADILLNDFDRILKRYNELSDYLSNNNLRNNSLINTELSELQNSLTQYLNSTAQLIFDKCIKPLPYEIKIINGVENHVPKCNNKAQYDAAKSLGNFTNKICNINHPETKHDFNQANQKIKINYFGNQISLY